MMLGGQEDRASRRSKEARPLRHKAKKLTAYSAPRNRRLAAEVYATTGTAVLFTIRAYTGRPFEASEGLCMSVVGLLGEMAEEYGCWVSAYCLMPNHLHLVAGPQEDG